MLRVASPPRCPDLRPLSSTRRITGSNASIIDPAGARECCGGSSASINRRTVRRLIPSRAAISRCETPSAADARTRAHSIALRTAATDDQEQRGARAAAAQPRYRNEVKGAATPAPAKCRDSTISRASGRQPSCFGSSLPFKAIAKAEAMSGIPVWLVGTPKPCVCKAPRQTGWLAGPSLFVATRCATGSEKGARTGT